MIALRHVLAKDLRRLRWLLLCWLIVVAARVVAAAEMSEVAFSGTAALLAAENVTSLLAIIDVVLLVVLASWLVHDEPLVGWDAFWLTRPIRPVALMSAKLVFGALFLVAAPAIVQFAVSAVIVRSFADASRGIPALAFVQGFWVALLIVVAAVTSSLIRFLLVLVGGVAAMALAMSALTTALVTVAGEEGYRESMLEDATTFILSAWLLLGLALLLIVVQYRTRRVGLTVLVAGVGLVFCLAIAHEWPWRFAMPIEPDPGVWAQDTNRVTAVLEPSEAPNVSEAFSVRRTTEGRKQIALPIQLTGIPRTFVGDLAFVRTRLTFPDGSALQSTQARSVPAPGDRGTPSAGFVRRLEGPLEPVRLFPRDPEGSLSPWPVVLMVSDADYERYGRTPGRLSAAVRYFLQEARIIGSLPLAEGASLRADPFRFEIRRVVKRQTGVSLVIRQVATKSSAERVASAHQFVLRNTQRSEATVGQAGGRGLHTVTSLSPWSILGLAWQLESSTPVGMVFGDVIVDYPSTSPVTAMPKIDAAWLEDSDIAVIESSYAGWIERTVALESFTMQR